MDEPYPGAQGELSRCINQLVLKEPFFGHLLAGVARQFTEETPTAGVTVRDGGLRLMVNPEFFLRTLRDRAERVGVVKHETLHLVLKHLMRAEEGQDPHVWNLATDLVVNQMIGAPWKLPSSAITLATFPELRLQPDWTAERYYLALAAAKAEADLSRASGRPQRAPRSAGALRENQRWHSDHDHWKRGGAQADVEAKVASALLDGLIEATANRVGDRVLSELPAMVRAAISSAAARRRPHVDWRRVVRLFAASSRRTRIARTNRRPSRRYGAFPGIRVRRFERLAVAVDTSASVSDAVLAEFFGEIHGIWRQGAEVHVIECDARVQRAYPYRGVFDGAFGRGGTRFDPVFEYLRRDREVRWDGCIYLTDGDAAAPAVRPPCRLLWVVTPDGRVGDHLRFGQTLRLPQRATG